MTEPGVRATRRLGIPWITALICAYAAILAVAIMRLDAYPLVWLNLAATIHCAVVCSLVLRRSGRQVLVLRETSSSAAEVAAQNSRRLNEIEAKINLILVATANKPPSQP
jgi:uncharacterized membrane protein